MVGTTAIKLTGMTVPPVNNQWPTHSDCSIRQTCSLFLPSQAYNKSNFYMRSSSWTRKVLFCFMNDGTIANRQTLQLILQWRMGRRKEGRRARGGEGGGENNWAKYMYMLEKLPCTYTTKGYDAILLPQQQNALLMVFPTSFHESWTTEIRELTLKS